LAPAIPLPAFRRDKPIHSERACLAPGLSATADLGAQLKGDGVTHRTPKAPCEKERRDRSCRRRARQNPATLCFYILGFRRLRSFFAVTARSEAGAGQADLLNGGSRSTLAEAPTKGENVQSQRRVPRRRDRSHAERTVDVESDEALVSGDAVEWALVLA
jgi:hypothetical protein